MRTDYWREAQEGLEVEDYPEVAEGSVDFPQSIFIAFAVCQKECGNRQFIVDSGTQICEKCGKMMFRIESKAYSLVQNQNVFDSVKRMLE